MISVEHCWNDTDRRKRKYRETNPVQCQCLPENLQGLTGKEHEASAVTDRRLTAWVSHGI